MSRRIVFAGSLQTRGLARVYRSEIAGQTGDDVVFIGTGAVNTDAARSTLLLADAVVMEVDEDGDAIPSGALPGRADIIRVPNLYCDFLWPFAGRAHPRNRGAFALPGGPYPAEHGDRFLDQMAADGVGEDEAIARYLSLDVVTEGELDSRLAERLDLIAKFDAASGFDLAGFIRDRFRTEALFRTRQRMTLPLVQRVADQLFSKLGLPAGSAGRITRVPFPAGAQPIHPAVIAHFGLTWTDAESRYPVNEEGYFTFAEHCRRYLRFDWNEALHRGIQKAKTDPAAALSDLEEGLAASPESPLGRMALAAARGEGDAAILIDEEFYDPELEPGVVPDDRKDAGAEAVEPDDAAEPVLTAAFPSEPDDLRDQAGHSDAFAPEEEPLSGALGGGGWAPEDELIDSAAPDADIHPDPRAAVYETPDHGEGGSAPGEDGAEAEGDEQGEAPAAPPIRFAAPSQPSTTRDNSAHEPGSVQDGFTDWSKPSAPGAAGLPDKVVVSPGNDLIEVLPRLLPVFSDLSSAVDRPFGSMPEVMPPPPLRPILPPELQGEAPKQGLLSRILGRK